MSEECEFFDEEYRPCLYTPQTKPARAVKTDGTVYSPSSTDLKGDKTAENTPQTGIGDHGQHQTSEENYIHNRGGSIRKDEQNSSIAYHTSTSFFIHPDNTYRTGLQRFIRRYTENWRKK